jgi:diguanylate cyclase (GGDEF)-like protein
VELSATLDEVVAIMKEKKYSCVVIAKNGEPHGIITERDMVGVVAELLSSCTTRTLLVEEFMTSPTIAIQESASLYEALVITQTHKIRHLPVVDEAYQLVGLLTQSDIAQSHFKAIETQREIIERLIKERTRELQDANAALKSLSLQDGLLGIGNRRAMEVDVSFTHANALRYHRPYSVALLDVDYFKLFNDHYGHQAGDDALKMVADTIQGSIRGSDRLYRYGGEEFLLLMPETSLADAKMVTERSLALVEAVCVAHEKSPYGHLTLSGGVSVVDGLGLPKTWQEVANEADEYLYAAKGDGRNRVAYNRSLLSSLAEEAASV